MSRYNGKRLIGFV